MTLVLMTALTHLLEALDFLHVDAINTNRDILKFLC